MCVLRPAELRKVVYTRPGQEAHSFPSPSATCAGAGSVKMDFNWASFQNEALNPVKQGTCNNKRYQIDHTVLMASKDEKREAKILI